MFQPWLKYFYQCDFSVNQWQRMKNLLFRCLFSWGDASSIDRWMSLSWFRCGSAERRSWRLFHGSYDEDAWIFRSAFRKNVVAKLLGSLLIEDSVFLEGCECVCIQYFCPFVSVITCGITAWEDMGEVGAHGAVFNLREQGSRRPGFLFERKDVSAERLLQCMPSHVEQSEADLTAAVIATVEVEASTRLLTISSESSRLFDKCTAIWLRNSRCVSQFSMIWDGSSTKSLYTLVPEMLS